LAATFGKKIIPSKTQKNLSAKHWGKGGEGGNRINAGR